LKNIDIHIDTAIFSKYRIDIVSKLKSWYRIITGHYIIAVCVCVLDACMGGQAKKVSRLGQIADFETFNNY